MPNTGTYSEMVNLHRELFNRGIEFSLSEKDREALGVEAKRIYFRGTDVFLDGKRVEYPADRRFYREYCFGWDPLILLGGETIPIDRAEERIKSIAGRDVKFTIRTRKGERPVIEFRERLPRDVRRRIERELEGFYRIEYSGGWRRKLAALGIAALLAGFAGAGVYCGMGKNKADKSSEKDYITLKEIREKKDSKLIKKYTWPLNVKIGEDSVLEEITDVNGQIVAAWGAGYRHGKDLIEIKIAGYGADFGKFVKQLTKLKIPHRSITYKEHYEKMNISYSPDLKYLNDVYSVLIPAEEFFKNKEKLIRAINQSTGIDEKLLAKDVGKLELKFEYPKLLDNVSFVIKDYKEMDVESAAPPQGDALKLEKILRKFTEEFYSKMLKNKGHDEAEFDKLVKSLLEREGYSIESLNRMKTGDVLKALARVVEENVEYDETKAELIKKGMEVEVNTPYQTLTTGKGVCSDYALAYEGIKRVLEDEIPKLKRVMVTRNEASGHEWNNIIYFNGTTAVIVPVDLSLDDSDGIPLGSKNGDTFADFSAIDEYHYFSR